LNYFTCRGRIYRILAFVNEAEISIIKNRMGITSSIIIALVSALSLFVMWQTIKTQTARKDAGNDLLGSEQDFRALGEEAPFGISIMGKDPRHDYLNP